MANCRVETLSPKTETLYRNFIQRTPSSLFYHTIKYRNFLIDLLDCKQHYLVAISNNQIVGTLPLLYKHFSEDIVYNSLPFYGSHGSILSEDESVAEVLIEKYNQLTHQENIISSTIIQNPFSRHYEFRYNFKDKRISQYTPLPSKQEELLSIFESSTKRNIKKAEKSGITIIIDNTAFKLLHELHSENMKVIGGLPKTKSFFELILEHFTPGIDFNLFVASHNDKPVAALLLFYYRNIVEYFTPALKEEYRTYQPLSLVVYKAMRLAIRNGFRTWNWGGTWKSQEGVYRFKKKWGAQEKEYEYYIQLNDENTLKRTSEDILNRFPNFYVIPFSQLKLKESIS